MEESAAAIATTATTTIIKATATTIAKTVVMLIVVEAIAILEIVAATAMIGIVEALEAWFVICAAIVVRPELPLAIITTITRSTATAASRIRS